MKFGLLGDFFSQIRQYVLESKTNNQNQNSKMVIQKPFISALKQVNPAIDLRESTIAHGWRSLLKLLVFNTPMISGKAMLFLP